MFHLGDEVLEHSIRDIAYEKISGADAGQVGDVHRGSWFQVPLAHIRGFRCRVKRFVLSGTKQNIRGFRCQTSGFRVRTFVVSGAEFRAFGYRASKIL